MKKYFTFILLSFTIIQLSLSQTLDIMTYNIRYDNPSDGENKWDSRKDEMNALLNYYHPAVIGTQEGMYHQLTYLDSLLTEFTYIGVGRKDGKKQGEYTAIFYDSTLLSVIFENTFWLSETGDTGSVGWDAALERICTFALFELKEPKKRFWLFNAHFDHVGIQAREQSAYLILNKIEKLNAENLPVIMLGDFNSEPSSKPIEAFSESLNDAREISDKPFYGPTGTFNDFNTSKVIDMRIDYIFVSGFAVNSYAHIDDRKKNNYYVSDHLPVLVRVEFDK
jgi:endonuclease/exonuclease/phosphatase family metal-dependent hydrolase